MLNLVVGFILTLPEWSPWLVWVLSIFDFEIVERFSRVFLTFKQKHVTDERRIVDILLLPTVVGGWSSGGCTGTLALEATSSIRLSGSEAHVPPLETLVFLPLGILLIKASVGIPAIIRPSQR